MPKNTMTEEHKNAISTGRVETTAVRGYLEALVRRRPKAGRQFTPEELEQRKAAIEQQIEESDPTNPMKLMKLIQDRRNIEHRLAEAQQDDDMESLEAAFVEHAKSFSERKGVEYGTWRELGVASDVLGRAGIKR